MHGVLPLYGEGNSDTIGSYHCKIQTLNLYIANPRERHTHKQLSVFPDLYLNVDPLLKRLTVDGLRVTSVFTDLSNVHQHSE